MLVQQRFPQARVMRMDFDTTRTKDAYEKILHAFANQEADILIGTQMIAKGLDFDHVSLVGILNADNVFKSPDFRAFERGFQLLSQVAGRAGRKDDADRRADRGRRADYGLRAQQDARRTA